MFERASDRHGMLLAPAVAMVVTSLAVVMGSAPAVAQQQEAGERIEEITVTGSRLVRRDLDAPSPVVVVSEAAIESAGNVTIEETLNELPQLASDNTSSVNSGGGSGILTADLRGLDPERTLVLVNGRRFTPANAEGFTDLSSILDALIERVEIITGGASAVYGSDAIAGAINFILKDDFEGLEASYYFGQTDKSDATTHKYDLTIGGNFAEDRGNAVVSASYTDRGNVFFADRDYSAISLFESGGTLVPGGSGNIPGTGLFLSSTQLAALNGLAFNPASACPGTISGIRFGDGGEILPFCDPEDRYNFAPDNYLLRPLERVQVSALGDFEVNDYVTAYTELFYMENRNEWQQAPNAGTLQTSGAARGSYLIPSYATNPVLFDPVRQFLIDNPATFDPDETVPPRSSTAGAARPRRDPGTTSTTGTPIARRPGSEATSMPSAAPGCGIRSCSSSGRRPTRTLPGSCRASGLRSVPMSSSTPTPARPCAAMRSSAACR